MSRYLSFLLVAGAIAVPATATAQTPAFSRAWVEMRAFYENTLKEEGIVGSGLEIVQGDSVLGRAGYGLADIATARAVDSSTIYHWASITKTFTAIAIMQLRDRGLLQLDDPIVKYVPELRAVHDTFGSIDDITIRHLLSHAAGFRNGTWPWGGDKPWHPFEPTRWSQVVAMMPYTEILFKPGTRFSYSNPGFIFLGRVIEALSGEDYEVYMEKNVLRPLGMSHSYFDRTPYHLLRYRSNNYTITKGVTTANGLDFDTGITVSNGGLNAPLTDMARYLKFLIGAPGLSEDARNVLARSSLEEMWKPVLPNIQGDGQPAGSVGLSTFINEVGGTRIIGHTGSQASFRSFFYLNPETHSAIIAVFNTVGADDDDHPSVGPLFSGLLKRYVDNVIPALRTGRR
ncbi:MAG: serine hydrolase domain-containing protein [Gemmatimonadota bacterium]